MAEYLIQEQKDSAQQNEGIIMKNRYSQLSEVAGRTKG